MISSVRHLPSSYCFPYAVVHRERLTERLVCRLDMVLEDVTE